MKTLSLVIVLALAGVSTAAQAAVTATLSSQQIGAGESVQLDVRSDARHGGPPDLAPLERDFRVLGSSSGSSIQIINGSMSVSTQVQLVLQPKRAGVLQVPSLRWDDETTPALALTVSAGAAPSATQPGGADTGEHVRVEASLAPGPLYVGGAALLTVRVLTDQPLAQASLDAPASADLALEQLGSDQQIRETRGGEPYQGIMRHYLVRPQRSGALVMGGPVLTAQVETPGVDPFFGRAFGGMRLPGMPGATRTVKIQARDIALTVRPRPASVDGRDWLPAASLALTANTDAAAGALHVGDPLKLRLQLRATGTGAAQLPDLGSALAQVLPDGLKAYPDQAKLGTSLVGDDINASRDQDVALIASRPGHYTVPALTVRWWDVRANAARVAEVPARVIDVLPAVTSTLPAAPSAAPLPAQRAAPAPAAQPGWQMSRTLVGIAVGAALFMAVAGLFLWWWRRRVRKATGQKVEPSLPGAAAAPRLRPDDATRAVRTSATANDADATRRNLLALAHVTWLDTPPAGLHALSARLAPGVLRQEIEALDRACYTGLAWQGAALVQALNQWPRAAASAQSGVGIAELYP
jgi:hypothetical protein